MDLRALDLPVVAAPMAGGVTTPGLVAAACAAGGTGFLAAGYLTPDAVADQIAATRALTGADFGVNLFVPERGEPDLAAARAYREKLLPLAAGLGVDLPDPRPDDDAWPAKLDLLLADPVPAVSLTFGLPDVADIGALRRAGTSVLATVTSPTEARAAAELGVDGLVVQGPEAGGHRATHDRRTTPGTMPLLALLAGVAAVTDLPLVAAGGIGTAGGVAEVLATGAVAAQVGTAFLLADEAGTSGAYRRALGEAAASGTESGTAPTRAFSGRVARGLVNAFMTEHPDAPPEYPQVNQVTGPLRRAASAQGRADLLSLWAGTAWRAARPGPMTELMAALDPRRGGGGPRRVRPPRPR